MLASFRSFELVIRHLHPTVNLTPSVLFFFLFFAFGPFCTASAAHMTTDQCFTHVYCVFQPIPRYEVRWYAGSWLDGVISCIQATSSYHISYIKIFATGLKFG